MKRIFFVALSTILILLTMDTTEVHAASERVVTVPILLYHRVSDQNSEQNRYAVSVDDFEAQMGKLDYWGY
jgi:peptidoglycan hydrolase CwlO-like protein